MYDGLGDDLYGGNISLINRQALHSYKISFIHPITTSHVTYESKIPLDMQNISLKLLHYTTQKRQG